MIYLWLAAGGAIGTIGRFLVANWIVQRAGPSPLGTFIVNVTGAFIIGFFLTVSDGRLPVSANVRAFVAVGILGGYTTFSTFSFDTLRLIRDDALLGALLYSVGSLVAGLIAVYLGVRLGRLT